MFNRELLQITSGIEAMYPNANCFVLPVHIDIGFGPMVGTYGGDGKVISKLTFDQIQSFFSAIPGSSNYLYNEKSVVWFTNGYKLSDVTLLRLDTQQRFLVSAYFFYGEYMGHTCGSYILTEADVGKTIPFLIEGGG